MTDQSIILMPLEREVEAGKTYEDTEARLSATLSDLRAQAAAEGLAVDWSSFTVTPETAQVNVRAHSDQDIRTVNRNILHVSVLVARAVEV